MDDQDIIPLLQGVNNVERDMRGLIEGLDSFSLKKVVTNQKLEKVTEAPEEKAARDELEKTMERRFKSYKLNTGSKSSSMSSATVGRIISHFQYSARISDIVWELPCLGKCHKMPTEFSVNASNKTLLWTRLRKNIISTYRSFAITGLSLSRNQNSERAKRVPGAHDKFTELYIEKLDAELRGRPRDSKNKTQEAKRAIPLPQRVPTFEHSLGMNGLGGGLIPISDTVRHHTHYARSTPTQGAKRHRPISRIEENGIVSYRA